MFYKTQPLSQKQQITRKYSDSAHTGSNAANTQVNQLTKTVQKYNVLNRENNKRVQ